MSEQRKRRRTHFSDVQVQGALLLRILGHWFLFLLTAGGILFVFELLSGDPHSGAGEAFRSLQQRYAPVLLAVLGLAPVFVRDLCKLSNRFAGPMVRLRRNMRNLAEGREVSPIKFREHDFWQDLAEDFNRVVARVQAVGEENSHRVEDSTLPEEEFSDHREEPARHGEVVASCPEE